MNADQLAARVEAILAEMLAPDVFRQRVEPDATDAVIYVLGAPSGTPGSFSFALMPRDAGPMGQSEIDASIRDMVRRVISKYGCAAA
jgi:hypothetical protein